MVVIQIPLCTKLVRTGMLIDCNNHLYTKGKSQLLPSVLVVSPLHPSAFPEEQKTDKYTVKAQTLYPDLDGISQMSTILDVYISAENKEVVKAIGMGYSVSTLLMMMRQSENSTESWLSCYTLIKTNWLVHLSLFLKHGVCCLTKLKD